MTYEFFSKASEKNNLANDVVNLKIDILPLNDSLKPDIFFIVFDEYTSSLSLKKYLGYDNAVADSTFIRQGFYIAENSKSNYNSTPFSLGSTFNLQYFNASLEATPPVPKLMLKAQYAFTESILPKLLKKEGYKVMNFGLLDIQEHPAPEGYFFQREYESIFYEETIWNRIKKDIWWNIAVKFPDQIVIKPYKKVQAEIINLNRRNFKNVLKELQYQRDTPKFIYGHFFVPHRPYYVNSSGQPNNVALNSYNISRDSLYLEQVAFCNKWIDSLTSAANKKFKRPRIVIIEGDHGYRDADDNQLIRDRELMNLSSYYFSDKDYRLLYKNISPVNSFRVILNKYFNTSFPLLKDSTILLH